MPKTLSNTQHDRIYETIARAEGEECIICHMEHFVPRKTERRKYKSPRGFKFEIDHSDSDRTNWAWSNLHLVCKKHNCTLRAMSTAKHITLLRGYSITLERERERENQPTWKSVLKDSIDYERASTEIQLNRNYRPRWTRYVTELIRERGSFNKKKLVVNAANKVGCSKQTSTNYLEVDTADDGFLKEVIDTDGEKAIAFRELPVRLLPPSIPRGTRLKLTMEQPND